MAPSVFFLSATLVILVALLDLSIIRHVTGQTSPNCAPIVATDVDRLQFALNYEIIEAEYLLCGSYGRGLEFYAPNLTQSGPATLGCQRTSFLSLDPDVARISEELAYQQIGNIGSIMQTVGGIQKPQINFTVANWALFINLALNRTLVPPFNPFANSLSFLVGAYAIPDLAQTVYAGTIPSFTANASPSIRQLVPKLLAIKAGQSGVIRSMLYKKANQFVPPYLITVRQFTDAISQLKNTLGKCGIKDEGLILPNTVLGAESRTTSNVLSADAKSLSYTRTEAEYLRIVYGSGNESIPGGFFPNGANGNLAVALRTA